MALMQNTLEDYASLPEGERLLVLDEWFGLGSDVPASDAIASTLHRMYMATDLTGVDNTDGAARQRTAPRWKPATTPSCELAVAMYDTNLALEAEDEALDGQLLEARPRFMEALLAFQADRGVEIYPDANGTLRVTFGNVQGYVPQDAVIYLPFTTAEGVAAKATGKEPFDAPPALLEAVASGRFRALRI